MLAGVCSNHPLAPYGLDGTTLLEVHPAASTQTAHTKPRTIVCPPGRSPKEIHTQATQRHVPECLWHCYGWQDKLEATPMAVNNKLDEKYGEPGSREHSEPWPCMFTNVLLHIQAYFCLDKIPT